MNPSQPENREQTFESKLSVILTKLDKGEYLGEGGVEGAMQAIKKLILEDVVGKDVDYEGTTMNWAIEHQNVLRAEQRQIINPQKEGK